LQGEKNMNNQEEIQTAWTLWHLMARLNELIWNRYENEFIEQYLKLEEEKYGQEQSDKDLFWKTD
jgi:hypothetical protein